MTHALVSAVATCVLVAMVLHCCMARTFHRRDDPSLNTQARSKVRNATDARPSTRKDNCKHFFDQHFSMFKDFEVIPCNTSKKPCKNLCKSLQRSGAATMCLGLCIGGGHDFAPACNNFKLVVTKALQQKNTHESKKYFCDQLLPCSNTANRHAFFISAGARIEPSRGPAGTKFTIILDVQYEGRVAGDYTAEIDVMLDVIAAPGDPEPYHDMQDRQVRDPEQFSVKFTVNTAMTSCGTGEDGANLCTAHWPPGEYTAQASLPYCRRKPGRGRGRPHTVSLPFTITDEERL